MCQYSNLYYETCQHFGLELREYCVSARWKGGMTGSLTICCPRILDPKRPDIEGRVPWVTPPSVPWEGIWGSCRQCVEEFKLPQTLYQPTRTRHYLPESQNHRLHRKENLAPYFYAPYLAATLPDLLGHGKEFDDSKRDKGPLIIFPWRLEQTDWATFRDSVPFQSQGMWDNETLQGTSVELAHKNLGFDMGMTEEEMQAVSQFIDQGVTPQAISDIWEANFEERGMSVRWFGNVCRNIWLKKEASEILAASARLSPTFDT